jgi:hypothetical protein
MIDGGWRLRTRASSSPPTKYSIGAEIAENFRWVGSRCCRPTNSSNPADRNRELIRCEASYVCGCRHNRSDPTGILVSNLNAKT